MALSDKLKAQVGQLAQKGKEAAQVGQAKLEELQAKRQADALYRELGAAYFAQHKGDASEATAATIDRTIEALNKWEAEHGPAPSADDEAAEE